LKAISGKTVKLDYNKNDLWIHADSRLEEESRAFSCQKEPETVQWIEKYVKKGEIVFDIGANVGAYSLIMAIALQGEGMVYSFEPNSFNFFQLIRNIKLNNLQETISAFNIALSSKKQICDFNYKDLVFGSSLHALGKAQDLAGDSFIPEFKQKMISYSIDDFVKEFNVPTINHMKIDVDGIEAEIIKGAVNTFSKKEFKSLMVELNDDLEEDVHSKEMLEGFGFETTLKVPNPSKFVKSDKVFNYHFVKI